MKANGRVFKYGNNVDTDVIIPAGYLNTSDPKESVMHCMEGTDSDFIKKVEKGDIIVASKNFGYGSSRGHAPVAIKENEVSRVIVSTFARIFYRDVTNIGLPIIECEEAIESTSAEDELEINFTTGVINNKSKKQEYKGEPFPKSAQKIISNNGLVNCIKSEEMKSEEGKSQG